MDLAPRSTLSPCSPTPFGVAEDPPPYHAERQALSAAVELGHRPDEMRRLRLAAELLKGLDETSSDRDQRSRRLRDRIAGADGRAPLADDPVELRKRLKRLARAADRDLAEQLELLVRFDERELYKRDGCRDMVLWMDV